MRINTEYLIDCILESFDNDFEYRKSSAIYFRKHGHGIHLDRLTTPEERHIAHYYHLTDSNAETLYQLCHILQLTEEETKRLYSITRAMKRWYEETAWQCSIPGSLVERIEKYVFE